MFVAVVELRVAGTVRRPGDPVPEVAAWPTLRSLLATHHVAFVPDQLLVESADVPPAPEPKTRRRSKEP